MGAVARHSPLFGVDSVSLFFRLFYGLQNGIFELSSNRQKSILSYFVLFFNASCLQYFKIISCWLRTAKSIDSCNCLIISVEI